MEGGKEVKLRAESKRKGVRGLRPLRPLTVYETDMVEQKNKKQRRK